MKKKNLIISIFSLLSLTMTSCSKSYEIPAESCDMEWDDYCNDNNKTIKLKPYTNPNYSFDEDITNKNGSVSYEIFVRSFFDTNNDGVGDLNGVKEKLPYLSDLGVKTLWLMPINPSPSYHGYDISDYYDINPDYGTLDDFKALIEEAKKYNIEIMMDIVFNHSSNQNPWFLESYKDYINNNLSLDSKKDWYCWSSSAKSGYNKYGQVYYESRFSSSMPEFNIFNQDVLNEMVKILDYWSDIGVKGYRFDACLYFDYNNSTNNANFLTYLKENMKDKDAYFVGETWSSIDTINEYYKSKCDSFFKFNASLEGAGNDAILAQVKELRKAKVFLDAIENEEKTLKTNNPNGYSSYFLSNHDMDRSAGSFDGLNAMDAASLYLLLPGTPFIYYGEEIGLKGNRLENDNTDVMRRLPLIWDKKDKSGECDFPEKGKEGLLLTHNFTQVEEGINDKVKEGYSLLNHYKKIINIRNKYDFIKDSYFESVLDDIVTENPNILAYKLYKDDESIIVIHNLTNFNEEVDVSKLNVTSIDNQVSASHIYSELSDLTLKIGRHSTVILK